MEQLTQDAKDANTLSTYLAVRDVPAGITQAPQADLCVVCGSSVLATV
jgi:hypothetical protein